MSRNTFPTLTTGHVRLNAIYYHLSGINKLCIYMCEFTKHHMTKEITQRKQIMCDQIAGSLNQR